MASATDTTCPKCFGTGHLRAFAHIANGDCFNCGATGKASASSASRATTPAYAADFKVIDTEIGQLTIGRFGTGFQAWHTDGMVWFDVVAGRVQNVELSIGFAGRVTTSKMQQILQGACRA